MILFDSSWTAGADYDIEKNEKNDEENNDDIENDDDDENNDDI